MREKLVGNFNQGFSVLEIIIALALLVTIIVSTTEVLMGLQYWSLTNVVANEALYKNKSQLETTRIVAANNFQSASSTLFVRADDTNKASDQECALGGFCFFTRTQVTDISSCAKFIKSEVAWRLGQRYSTSSITLPTYLADSAEIIAQSGDCVTILPENNWLISGGKIRNSIVREPLLSAGIDLFNSVLYVVASSSPQLSMYTIPENSGDELKLVGSSTFDGNRLNAIEIWRDYGSGRQYAYVMQHVTNQQLGTIDVTDISNPQWLNSSTLLGVNSSSSFPQGWRLIAYGKRLYVVTRETAGPELHIFSLDNPREPLEISSARFDLNRTVNDLLVRDQMIDGVRRRFLYIAGSANLKELGIFDVTGDVPIELKGINLSGTEDAISIYLNGNSLYLGRKNRPSGPELYVFSVTQLLSSASDVSLRESEVGADVHTIRGAANVLYVGTNKIGAELQVWKSDIETWSTVIVGAGRTSSYPYSRLAPLGLDLDSERLVLVSQSGTQSEVLQLMHSP